ncbi:hypothetical protein C8J57DRAFT_1242501 [Mycena rebaudengoi]|nr:hypothetical protein C8J57DRAFT_1242501 [Mycena rebaudengoi]
MTKASEVLLRPDVICFGSFPAQNKKMSRFRCIKINAPTCDRDLNGYPHHPSVPIEVDDASIASKTPRIPAALQFENPPSALRCAKPYKRRRAASTAGVAGYSYSSHTPLPSTPQAGPSSVLAGNPYANLVSPTPFPSLPSNFPPRQRESSPGGPNPPQYDASPSGRPTP